MKTPKRTPVKKWSSKKIGQIAFWTGRGRSSKEIAEILGDKTNPATIRAVWYRWGLPRRSRAQKSAFITFPVSYNERLIINRRAKRLNVAPEDFIRRVSFYAAKDDLYHAIVDGRK
ncbi:hypothetical protein OIV19_03420 [Brucella sp. HL-2]|nr:hypothetical protein [Brucella sp. HL-2]MCV9906665.1 hypothetical protein [Brucella sp. HL-2]